LLRSYHRITKPSGIPRRTGDFGLEIGSGRRDFEAASVSQAHEIESARPQIKSRRPKLQLAEAFKKDFDDPRFTGLVVAKSLAAKVGHGVDGS
jgi:hypothetical protein